MSEIAGLREQILGQSHQPSDTAKPLIFPFLQPTPVHCIATKKAITTKSKSSSASITGLSGALVLSSQRTSSSGTHLKVSLRQPQRPCRSFFKLWQNVSPGRSTMTVLDGGMLRNIGMGCMSNAYRLTQGSKDRGLETRWISRVHQRDANALRWTHTRYGSAVGLTTAICVR